MDTYEVKLNSYFRHFVIRDDSNFKKRPKNASGSS